MACRMSVPVIACLARVLLRLPITTLFMRVLFDFADVGEETSAAAEVLWPVANEVELCGFLLQRGDADPLDPDFGARGRGACVEARAAKARYVIHRDVSHVDIHNHAVGASELGLSLADF